MKWGHDLILCKINFFLQFISSVKAVVRLIPQPEIYVALYLKFFYFFLYYKSMKWGHDFIFCKINLINTFCLSLFYSATFIPE